MQKGTIIVYNDLMGFYVGSDGMYTLVLAEDDKVHRIIVPDLDKLEVANPYALANLHYTKLVAIARNTYEKS